MTRIFAPLALAASLIAGPALAETLQVGAYPSNPPWEFKNEQSEFEGFEVDLVKEVAERLGVDIDIKDYGFQALFAATSSGRIDLAISSITITPDRLQNQDFTQGYYDSDLGLVTNQDGVASLDAMEGEPVGAIAASVGEKWIQEHSEEYGFGDYKSYTTQQNLLLDVANGRVAAGIGDILGFEFAAEQNPSLKVAQRIKTGESFAMMLPKNSDDLERVNQAITEIKEDGTLDEIYRQWLEAEPAEGTSGAEVRDIPRRDQ